jgi:hypothetical protein
MKKAWRTSADPCEYCQAVAKMFDPSFGGKATGLGQAFLGLGSVLTGVNGGTMSIDYTDIMSPPIHPQCRCSLVAEFDV